MCPSRAKVINYQCVFIISPQREADVLSLQNLLLSEIYLCVYSVCMCTTCVQVPTGARRDTTSSRTEVTEVVQLMWVLDPELGFPGRAERTLNHWAVSPVLQELILHSYFGNWKIQFTSHIVMLLVKSKWEGFWKAHIGKGLHWEMSDKKMPLSYSKWQRIQNIVFVH